MGLSKNQDRRNPGQEQYGIDAMAGPYVPPIKEILPFKQASPALIKTGIEAIEKLVKNNSKITAHQVRNIFALITDLGPDPKRGLQLLRPRLAYVGARQKEKDGKIIVKVIDELIKSIDLADTTDNINEKIEGLQYVMESIVAYHKFHSNN